MSINLMSAIFRTEFRDLQDAEGNTTKASTAKFVCIALADHANDEGEGAYPSINKVSLKTSLSRTAVINALDALKVNGILIANGPSKYDTINYTVNPSCFSQGSQPGVLVIPLDPPSQPEILPPVNPVDPNHTLTIHKPYIQNVQENKEPNVELMRGDWREYPEHLHKFAECLRDTWKFVLPSRPQKRSKISTKYSMFIVALEEIRQNCAEFNVKALQVTHEKWRAGFKDGIAPYTVATPMSLINVVAATAREMRESVAIPQKTGRQIEEIDR